ncbi:MAG: 1,2-phenylacetyl-CoA epoxidase subunit PaaE [Ferruginibacter sp.]
MAVHFHPLTVKNIQTDTPESIIITFHIPENLQDTFSFIQGQNLTLKSFINGEEIRRSYSICSAPFENELQVAIRKTTNGKFSGYANDYMKAGDSIEVLPPTGRFYTKLNPCNKNNYLAIAAGSGITPIISIIKTTLNTEPNGSFTLIYGNRSRSSIMFFEALEALKNQYMARFNFVHILSREKTDASINSGKINAEKLTELGKLINYNAFDEIFICGPEQMLFCAKDYLELQGVNKKNIHFELFTTPGQKTIETTTSKTDGDNTAQSNITIKLDGRSVNFKLAFNSESILDAALKQGADLPFACKGGVCSTCRAMVTEGKVSMDNNYALENEELEQGYILTCQSHPLTAIVSIDFDKR